jgi:regulator of replication initiation timing
LKELKLQKCLKKYNPKSLEQLMERFGIGEQELEDSRFGYMMKKITDDERHIGELKATIGELVAERTRLKLRVNALITKVTGKIGATR